MATLKDQVATLTEALAKQTALVEALLARKGPGGQSTQQRLGVSEEMLNVADKVTVDAVSRMALGMEDIETAARIHVNQTSPLKGKEFFEEVRKYAPNFEEHNWRDSSNSYQTASGKWENGYYTFSSGLRAMARVRLFVPGHQSAWDVDPSKTRAKAARIAAVIMHLRHLATSEGVPERIKGTALATLTHCGFVA